MIWIAAWLVGGTGCSLGRLGLPTPIEARAAPAACAARADSVDEARTFAAIKALAKTPRRTDAQRDRARAFLTDALKRAGRTVEARPFTVAGVSGINLVAPGAADATVLVGAHYDSVGSSPGADDNASGVAVALEVARVLGPDAPVDIVLFDAEEPPSVASARPVGTDGRNYAYGSQAFVDAGVRYEVAIIVESVGYRCSGCQQLPSGLPAGFVEADGEAVYWVVGGSAERWPTLLGAFIEAAAPTAALAVDIPNRGAQIRESRFSDHAPFWDAGIDAVMITDTALLRNPHYHRRGDTPEILDPAFVAATARGTVAAAAAAAGACRSAGVEGDQRSPRRLRAVPRERGRHLPPASRVRV